MFSAKKMVSAAAVLGLGFSLATTTFALDSTASSTAVKAPIRAKTAAIQKVQSREEMKDTRMASREALLKQLKANMATREAALKAKIAAFKDKQKADLTQKISDNLNKINKQKTEQMDKHISQISDVLARIENKSAEGSISGKITPGVLSAIDNAKTAINTAQSAVDAQAAKDYTVMVTGETKVKSDVQSKRDQLHADLKETRQKVIDARQAVSNAYSLLTRTLKGANSGQ